MMNLGKYAKSVTALVTGLIGWATMVANHPGGFHNITAVYWIGLATVVAVAFGVYAVPNQPVSTLASVPISGPQVVIHNAPPNVNLAGGSAAAGAAPVKGVKKTGARQRG